MIDILVFFGKHPFIGIVFSIIILAVGLPLTASKMEKGSPLIPLFTFIVTMIISLAATFPELTSYAIKENDKYRVLISEDNKQNLNLSESDIKKLKQILASDN